METIATSLWPSLVTTLRNSSLKNRKQAGMKLNEISTKTIRFADQIQADEETV